MRMLRDWREFFKGRLFRKRPLIKDPFAIFSAEWFAERLGCSIVVVVRHPAAVVNSLRRLGWPFGFNDLLRQPYLMRDWLEPYQAEMEKLLASPDDAISSGSLLWRMIYSMVDQMSSQIPDLVLVRHEDISLEPVENFRILYDLLDLEFDQGVEQRIFELSKANNPKELSRKTAHSVRLDSRASVTNWKHRLSVEDIRRVRELTEEVAARYYSDEEWL
jgi:hypothetical protein